LAQLIVLSLDTYGSKLQKSTRLKISHKKNPTSSKE